MTLTTKVLPFTRANRFPVAATDPSLKASNATLPKRIPGCFSRPRLLERYRPLERRLGILQAPCGFGKTTLLNEICHREQDQGTLVAWLRLDEDVTDDLLSNYLAFAFARGGLDLSSIHEHCSDDRRARINGYRIGMLMRALEDYGKPCLLALDEVERLTDRDAIATIDFLVRRSPRNLHFAVASRSISRGLDLVTTVLDHRCVVLTVDDLRFTNPEVALFLGGGLSREELVAAVQRTEGWPVALRTYRDMQDDGKDSSGLGAFPGYQAMVEEFVGARLMRNLTSDCREFLLDLGVFAWIDRSLVEEVFESDCVKLQTELMSMLRGLIRSVDQGDQVLRLHPVVREYCRVRRQREDPGRFRRLHRRLAIAMARRGDLDEAVRHARSTGDVTLFGEILEVGCGAGLLFGTGVEPFLNAVGCLRGEAAIATSQLAYMRTIALLLNGNELAAEALFRSTSTSASSEEQDRGHVKHGALRADRFIAHSMLLAFTCRPVGEEAVHGVLKELESIASDDILAPVLRGSVCTILCISDHQRARFQRSRQWEMKARKCFSLASSEHGRTLVDIQRGVVAMAQGRVKDAMAAYTRCGSVPGAKLLQAELQIERNRVSPGQAEGILDADLGDISGWLGVHAAAHGVRAEMAFENGGIKATLSVLEDSLELATRRNLVSLVRLLSAQRVTWLAAAGHVDAAQGAWEDAGLPVGPAEQLDLDGQTWREMEAIACARISVLRAGGDFSNARRLARKLRDTASARGLTRTLMRCLVEWMVLEYQAQATDTAIARLQEFLRHFRVADYWRSLTHYPDVTVRLFRRLLDKETELDTREHAESLLQEIRMAADEGNLEVPRYSAQEIKVLEGLAQGRRDKEIARLVGLTENGVRYHLKKIYRKMGVSRRGDAVLRARSAGVV